MSAAPRRCGAQLSRASMACLQHLAAEGTASGRELEALQRGLNPQRSPVAIQHTAYNLQSQGYIQRAQAEAGVSYELTPLGRAAVAREPAAFHKPQLVAEAPRNTTRPVRYGTGFVFLPNTARWVFDLGVTS